MKSEHAWSFGEASERPIDEAVVVKVSASVATKTELFITYEAELGFPDYFGANWDAFEECIRDLSWVKSRRIILSHDGLPFSDNPNLLATYLSILNGAAEKWGKLAEHDIMIHFPRECEPRIRKILSTI